MPPAKRKPAADSPSKAKKPQAALKPTLQVTKVAKVPTNSRYNLGAYPWDDYQDDIVVNSVEHADPRGQKPLVGIDHYKQSLSQVGHYKHITYDFEDYRTNGKKREDMPDIEEDDLDIDVEHDAHSLYTTPPTPPETQDDYDECIYHGRTRNPAVCLAIIRIAQRNLPFIDFSSSLNHLPNLPLDAPVPKLPTGVFAEDIPHERQATDIEMNLAFLPRFYHDNRHALGFFTTAPVSRPGHPTRSWTKTILFTPCSTADLKRFEMVEWLPGNKRRDGVKDMQAVGSRDGSWLKPDVEEDWPNWSVCWKVVWHVWERRMGLCQGVVQEAPR
jgi:hypothetical protein